MEPMSVAWKIAAALPQLKEIAIAGVATYHSGVIISSPTTVRVRSKTKGWIPVTRVAANGWYCYCDGFRFSKVRINDQPLCKHIMAALFAIYAGDTEDEFIARLRTLTLRPIVEVRFAVSSKPGEVAS